MDKTTFVYLDSSEAPQLVGQLWSHARGTREVATFEYDENWLAQTGRFSLEPGLPVGQGKFQTRSGAALFGSIGDSAPDRWGRALIRRAERRRADEAGSAPVTLNEIEYLLRVDDEARQGALRFAKDKGGDFLAVAAAGRIPPLIELPRLLSAAEHVIADTESDEELNFLLAPGSSLGGARPKASVKGKNGNLMIAKFPHREDEFDKVSWEALALTLAGKSGISVPAWRVEKVGRQKVLLVDRFDRSGGIRIPFLSAMSMLEANDNEPRSYLEIADALRRFGSDPKADMRELWRRIVFNVLISNTDDHLRNHGFLHDGGIGWRLSPAYDMNPTPVEVKPRVLTTNITETDGTASLDHAFEVADYFQVNAAQARKFAAKVGKATAGWKEEAARIGVSKAEIKMMRSAFEHSDLELALN